MAEDLKEKVVIEMSTPKAVGGGLSDTLKQLHAIDLAIGKIQAKIAGLKVDNVTRGHQQILTDIKTLQSKTGDLNAQQRWNPTATPIPSQ